MKESSNLPPGVSHNDIERQAGAFQTYNLLAEAKELVRNAEPLGDGYMKVLTHDIEAIEGAIEAGDSGSCPYGHSPINMEGLTRDELKEVAQLYHSLLAYAETKLAAMGDRETGNIRAALLYETRCDQIYKDLPEWARW